MRELVFGTIFVAAAAAGVYFVPLGAFGGGGADYAMSVSEARGLLGKADLRKGKEPFGTLDVLVTSPQANIVRYEAGGTFAALDCRAELTPVGDSGIDVATSCKRSAPSDGAAAPTAEDITGIAFAEYVASVLGKRAFNDTKVRNRSAGAVFRNLGDMQRDALNMQRDMARDSDSVDDEPTGEYVDPEMPNEDYSSGESAD